MEKNPITKNIKLQRFDDWLDIKNIKNYSSLKDSIDKLTNLLDLKNSDKIKSSFRMFREESIIIQKSLLKPILDDLNQSHINESDFSKKEEIECKAK